ncbi:MAG: hypothetical protein HW403_1430 [Dehalococcoidia bacterium]|nr:hypothetical protein [Dehalococcoidia bacterium]
MEELEIQIQNLKARMIEHPGINIANRAFTQEVDSLISAFYDDIGEIKNIGIKSLFDLFIIKALYVDRGSTDPNVIDYLSNLMGGFLFSREFFPLGPETRRYGLLLTDILEEMQNLTHFQNLFEAYRKFGDYSLFITVFPASLRRMRHRYGRRMKARDVPVVDIRDHMLTGQRFYMMAAEHRLAEETQQRPLLSKLSNYFQVYMEALNDVSDKYILGFDMNLIADKMLDNFNLYRSTGDRKYMENAQKYAALLKVDRATFPSLFRMRRRRAKPTIL